MPRLVINPGTPHQWEAQLRSGTNTLGRSPACDVQIEHGSVSGTHCEVTVNGDSIVVRDLGSTNGTFLDRAPVEQGTLAAGQRLQLGGVEMELAPDGAARATATPVGVRLAVARPAGTPPPSAVPVPAASSAGPSAPPPPPARMALKVTAHEAPPPPPSAPASYVPEEYTAEAEAPAMCKYHPKAYARFLCPQCQIHFCELCVTSRPGGTRTNMFCRRCSAECVALNVAIQVTRNPKENFLISVPGAFLYPFKGVASIFFLLFGSVVFGVLDSFLRSWLFGGIFIKLFIIGYTFAYMQKIIHVAAQGADDRPGFPDVSEFVQDLLIPGLQLIGIVLVSFGPMIAAVIWVGADAVSSGTVDPVKSLLLLGVLLGGIVYFPMALLAVAMHDSILAVNPLVVIPAMLKVPLEYLVVLIVMAAAAAARVTGAVLLPRLMDAPGLTTLLSMVLTLYLLTVVMRLLGLMYYAKREKLHWLRG